MSNGCRDRSRRGAGHTVPRPPATQELTPQLSFFEEDEEPTRVRRQPRPRRATPAGGGGGGGSDQQTVWTRRGVAIGGLVLLFILLVLVINACQDSRRKNALRDFNRQAQAIVTASDDEVGKGFFDTMRRGASQSPENLQTQVSSLRAQADSQLQQAEKL